MKLEPHRTILNNLRQADSRVALHLFGDEMVSGHIFELIFNAADPDLDTIVIRGNGMQHIVLWRDVVRVYIPVIDKQRTSIELEEPAVNRLEQL